MALLLMVARSSMVLLHHTQQTKLPTLLLRTSMVQWSMPMLHQHKVLSLPWIPLSFSPLALIMTSIIPALTLMVLQCNMLCMVKLQLLLWLL